MKDLEQLEKETIQETKDLEEKALELYIKAQIEQRIERTAKVEEDLARLHSIKAEQTIEYFKKTFNSYSPNHSSTYKEYYIEKLKD